MSESAKCSRPECQGKIFSRPSALRRHVKAIHEKSEPAFSCGRCQKTFSRKEYLFRHEEAHRGYGSMECSICLRFFRFDYFDKHRMSCKARVTKIRIPAGSQKSGRAAGVLKQYELRWGNNGHEAEDNIPELPSAMTDASVLRTAPSLHSNEFWRERVLVEKARLAIKGADLELFGRFVQDLDNSGLTLKTLDNFIKEAPTNWDEPDIPLLCLAASYSTPLLVESLLNLGADVNEKTWDGRTAINFAKDADSAHFLICAGAETLIRDGADTHRARLYILDTPLRQAVKGRDVKRASILLEVGARINMHSSRGTYLAPINLAVRLGDLQMFDLFLRAAVDQHLELPPITEMAIRQGSLSMRERLLEHGAGLEIRAAEAEALFKDMLKCASEQSDAVPSIDAAKKIAVIRKHLAQFTAGLNKEAALHEDMNAMPDLIWEEPLTPTSLEQFHNFLSRSGEQTHTAQQWTPEVFSRPPQPSPFASSSDQDTPPASSSQPAVLDWFQFFGLQSLEVPSLPSAEQDGSLSHDFAIQTHVEPQVAPSDLATRAESQDTDVAALRKATTLLKDNGLLDQTAFATLTASIDERRRTATPQVEEQSPEQMQKRDPLGMQIWRLYHRQVGQLPNAERLENLSWRMMSINLRRKEMERQRRLAHEAERMPNRSPDFDWSKWDAMLVSGALRAPNSAE